MKSNPILRKAADKTVTNVDTSIAMTKKGTQSKIVFLIALVILSFMASWAFLPQAMIIVASIVSLLIALILIFTMRNNIAITKTLGPIYAITEGVLLGGVSRVVETQYPGIAFQTAVLTVLAVLGTLALHKKHPSLGGKIRTGVIAATLTILGTYILGLIFTLLGVPFILFGNGPIGIAFSLFCVGVAIANLMLDYDIIERCIESRYSKEYEWYFAFGVLVTIVWIYAEILELLIKIARRTAD